jgi:hypothetical protein
MSMRELLMSPAHRQALLGPGGCLTSALADGEGVMLRVNGGCMQPDLVQGAAVRIQCRRWFIPGDVVAFHCPHQNRLLMHRFLGYVPSHRAWKLMIMADRGLRPDVLVDGANVLGRVVTCADRGYQAGPWKRVMSVYRYLFWSVRFLAGRVGVARG